VLRAAGRTSEEGRGDEQVSGDEDDQPGEGSAELALGDTAGQTYFCPGGEDAAAVIAGVTPSSIVRPVATCAASASVEVGVMISSDVATASRMDSASAMVRAGTIRNPPLTPRSRTVMPAARSRPRRSGGQTACAAAGVWALVVAHALARGGGGEHDDRGKPRSAAGHPEAKSDPEPERDRGQRQGPALLAGDGWVGAVPGDHAASHVDGVAAGLDRDPGGARAAGAGATQERGLPPTVELVQTVTELCAGC
jgi:hypothetical protein